MSRSLARPLVAAFIASLGMTTPAIADGFGVGLPRNVGPRGGACGACGYPVYVVSNSTTLRPPSYHRTVPYGYYESSWSRWPTHRVPLVPPSSDQPSLAPEMPVTPLPHPHETEPLPAPRLLQPTRGMEGPMLPQLQPAGYPKR